MCRTVSIFRLKSIYVVPYLCVVDGVYAATDRNNIYYDFFFSALVLIVVSSRSVELGPIDSLHVVTRLCDTECRLNKMLSDKVVLVSEFLFD